MSIQSARDFLTKVTKDEEFRKGLGGCKSGADQHQFARAAGFEFTGDEMRAVAGELQDAELDVSGGSCGCGYTCEVDCCGSNSGETGH
jgi:predicted ribosomally synthesized peptide with nif11-like leader